jgi:hypothetical protein
MRFSSTSTLTTVRSINSTFVLIEDVGSKALMVVFLLPRFLDDDDDITEVEGEIL